VETARREGNRFVGWTGLLDVKQAAPETYPRRTTLERRRTSGTNFAGSSPRWNMAGQG